MAADFSSPEEIDDWRPKFGFRLWWALIDWLLWVVFGEGARKHWENNQCEESNPQRRNVYTEYTSKNRGRHRHFVFSQPVLQEFLQLENFAALHNFPGNYAAQRHNFLENYAAAGKFCRSSTARQTLLFPAFLSSDKTGALHRAQIQVWWDLSSSLCGDEFHSESRTRSAKLSFRRDRWSDFQSTTLLPCWALLWRVSCCLHSPLRQKKAKIKRGLCIFLPRFRS